MIEIGSEYPKCEYESGNGLTFPEPGSLVFSGRTAIEAVLNCIPVANTALLPSYCCDSMIEPFRKAGLSIDFFDVNFDKDFYIGSLKSSDVLLWNNYFGFELDMPEFDGIIIEDITHSLFSKKQYYQRSDYYVASIRKWEPVLSGGYCSIPTSYSEPPQEFLDKKLRAMELKAAYLDGAPTRKESYLSLFQESNEWLANNYSHLSIDDYSREYLEHVDVVEQRAIRRSNAEVLYRELEGKVQFMFSIEQMDCPLFVPILLPNNRDRVKKHLIENNIYCPVHWPHPNADCESNIYDMELSLICDQRYGEEDMMRIVDTILEVI